MAKEPPALWQRSPLSLAEEKTELKAGLHQGLEDLDEVCLPH